MGLRKMDLGGGSTPEVAPSSDVSRVRLQNAVSFVEAAVGAIKVDYSQGCLGAKDIDLLTPVFEEMTSDEYTWLFNCIDYMNAEGLTLDEYISDYRDAVIEPDDMGPVTPEYKEDIINKLLYFVTQTEDGEYVVNVPRWLAAFNLHLGEPIPEQYRFTSAEALEGVDVSKSTVAEADSAIASNSTSWDTFKSFWFHQKPNVQDKQQTAKYFVTTAEGFLAPQSMAQGFGFGGGRPPRNQVLGVHYTLFTVDGDSFFAVKVKGSTFSESDEVLLNVYIQELGRHGIKAELLHGEDFFKAEDFPGAPV